MADFQRGDTVLIKFNPYEPAAPVGRGQVVEVNANGLIDVIYEPDSRIARFQPGLLVSLEDLSEERLTALHAEFGTLGHIYHQLAEAAENGGEIGVLRQALNGVCDLVWKNDDGSYAAEGRATASSHRFRIDVTRRLRDAGFTLLCPRTVLDSSKPFGRGSVYRITFRVVARELNMREVRPRE